MFIRVHLNINGYVFEFGGKHLANLGWADFLVRLEEEGVGLLSN